MDQQFQQIPQFKSDSPQNSAKQPEDNQKQEQTVFFNQDIEKDIENVNQHSSSIVSTIQQMEQQVLLEFQGTKNSQSNGNQEKLTPENQQLENKQIQFINEIQKLKEYFVNNSQFFESQLLNYNKELCKYREIIDKQNEALSQKDQEIEQYVLQIKELEQKIQKNDEVQQLIQKIQQLDQSAEQAFEQQIMLERQEKQKIFMQFKDLSVENQRLKNALANADSQCEELRKQQQQRILDLEENLLNLQKNQEQKVKNQSKSKNFMGKMQLDLHKFKDTNLLLKEQLKDVEYKQNLIMKEKQDLIVIVKQKDEEMQQLENELNNYKLKNKNLNFLKDNNDKRVAILEQSYIQKCREIESSAQQIKETEQRMNDIMQSKQQELDALKEMEEKKNKAESVILELQVENEKMQWNEQELKKQISDQQLKINELQLNIDDLLYQGKKQLQDKIQIIESQNDQIQASKQEISTLQTSSKFSQEEIYRIKEKNQQLDQVLREQIQSFKADLEKKYQDLIEKGQLYVQQLQQQDQVLQENLQLKLQHSEMEKTVNNLKIENDKLNQLKNSVKLESSRIQISQENENALTNQSIQQENNYNYNVEQKSDKKDAIEQGNSQDMSDNNDNGPAPQSESHPLNLSQEFKSNVCEIGSENQQTEDEMSEIQQTDQIISQKLDQ